MTGFRWSLKEPEGPNRGTMMRALTAVVVIAGGLALAACETGPRTEIKARFDCDDGQRLSVVFDHKINAAVVEVAKGQDAVLPSRNPEAGIWYAGEGFELKGAGDTLNYSAPGRASTRCVQTR